MDTLEEHGGSGMGIEIIKKSEYYSKDRNIIGTWVLENRWINKRNNAQKSNTFYEG